VRTILTQAEILDLIAGFPNGGEPLLRAVEAAAYRRCSEWVDKLDEEMRLWWVARQLARCADDAAELAGVRK
jgi:hypothetical protein